MFKSLYQRVVHRPSIKDHRLLTIDHRLLPTDHRSSSIVHRPQTIVFFLILVLIISSCTTQKQLTYLQGIDEVGEENFFPYSRPEYRLQKQDVLYVSIVTLNEEVNLMLNPGGTQSSQQMSQGQGGAYLMGYTIRDSGNINIPLIGDVFVLNKTMEESVTLIENKTSKMFKDARVDVKLLSYRFTVLGEVDMPGSFVHYGNQLTVFDAIGMAGDLSDYGDRSRVLVVRPTNEGSTSYRINLKDKSLLKSEGYFILPNDIVIVEPRYNKLLSLNAPAVSLFFSSAFSTISLALIILSLDK